MDLVLRLLFHLFQTIFDRIRLTFSVVINTARELQLFPQFITCRAKLLNADWMRQRAFFLNQEGTFGNQEGMIT